MKTINNKTIEKEIPMIITNKSLEHHKMDTGRGHKVETGRVNINLNCEKNGRELIRAGYIIYKVIKAQGDRLGLGKVPCKVRFSMRIKIGGKNYI